MERPTNFPLSDPDAHGNITLGSGLPWNWGFCARARKGWRTSRVQVVDRAPDKLLKRVLVVAQSFFAVMLENLPCAAPSLRRRRLYY